MLYHFLKILFRISRRIFFRNYEVKGLEKVPSRGPMIIVANHPSTFMDPILIATAVKPRVYFLAKAEVFKSRIAKIMFPGLNMIPIYRKQDDPKMMHKNDEMFERCFEHLEKGGTILIFPEGVSLTERKLKQIKTGAARIALGAEARNNFQLGVKVVSIGLNYSNPHKFQSNVFMNVDDPINIRAYKETYLHKTHEAVNKLTDDIRESLEKVVVSVEDQKADELLADIEEIYKAQVIREMGFDPGVKENDFIVTRAISDHIHYFMENEPERVEKISTKITSYLDNLDRLKINDRLIRRTQQKGPVLLKSFFSFIYLVIGFPLFLFGTLNNFIPFRLPGIIAKKVSSYREYYGAITMVGGTVIFLIFYTAQALLIQHFFDTWWITILYVLSLPLTGLFAFSYWKFFTNVRGKWMVFTYFYKRTSLISSLIVMRQEIIKEMEKARKDYEQAQIEKISIT